MAGAWCRTGHSVGRWSCCIPLARAAVRVNGGWVIAASKAGHPSDPAWAHNLRAHPDQTIVEYADEAGVVRSARVRVSELAGEERSATWERFVAAAPMFGEYQVKAGDRIIPLFELTLAE